MPRGKRPTIQDTARTVMRAYGRVEGEFHCPICGRYKWGNYVAAVRLVSGWPKCCGEQMRVPVYQED